MSPVSRYANILIAEDDDDDFQMIEEALKEALLENRLRRVGDGEELLDYLHHRSEYADREESPDPKLILLDLNMPRKSGREALQEIKDNPALRHLPVVVLTTSRADEDVMQAYALGVNSFIRKPSSFAGLVEALRVFNRYWFELVELPRE